MSKQYVSVSAAPATSLGALTHRRCRSPWVTGLAALAFVAVACTGAADDEAADEVTTQLTLAATETAAASAAPTAAPTTTVVEPPVDAMDLLQTAFINSAALPVRGIVGVQISELGITSARFKSDGNRDFSLTMRLGEMIGGGDLGIRMEVRFVDGVRYLQFVVPEELRELELVGDELPEGWFTLDEASAAALGMACPNVLPGDSLSNGTCRLPNDFTDQLGFVAGAEIIGSESLGDAPAIHVRYVLDAVAMVGAAFQGLEDSAELPFSQLELIKKGVVVDTWIDERSGLVRSLIADFGQLMADFGEGETQRLPDELMGIFDTRIAIELYDYHVHTMIGAPPADEIVGDFGDMMGAGFGAG